MRHRHRSIAVSRVVVRHALDASADNEDAHSDHRRRIHDRGAAPRPPYRDHKATLTLAIESPAFAGKSRVERQRLVYAALGDLMDERIHALSIRATAPGEINSSR